MLLLTYNTCLYRAKNLFLCDFKKNYTVNICTTVNPYCIRLNKIEKNNFGVKMETVLAPKQGQLVATDVAYMPSFWIPCLI